MTQEITKTLKEISLNFSYVSEQSLFVTVTLVLFYLLSQCHIFSLQHRFCYNTVQYNTVQYNTVTLVLFYLLSQCHIFSLQHRFCYANKKELVCWQILLINFKKSC